MKNLVGIVIVIPILLCFVLLRQTTVQSSRIDELENKITNLEKRGTDFQPINVEDEIKKLKTERESLQDEITDLKAKVEKLEDEIKKLKTERESLQDEITDLKAKIGELEDEIKKLEKKIKS